MFKQLLLASSLFCAATAQAQDRIPSHCVALAGDVSGVQIAALGGHADFLDEEVRLHYVGHSTYVIETAGGLVVATDFTGYVGINIVPDLVTMNHAHDSHWTAFPDPAIKHVLRGWKDENGRPAEHFIDLGEMVVRNITTDIRSGFEGGVKDDNSIFLFEVAGLCIGHLGHLHHEPSNEQYALIGRLDVVMAPVDGGLTVPVDVMVKIMKRARASVILPMHWWGSGSLQRFVDGLGDDFAVEWREDKGPLTISLRSLPHTPTIIVLQPGTIRNQ